MGEIFFLCSKRDIFTFIIQEVERRMCGQLSRKTRNAKSIFQIHCNVNSKYQIVSLFPENRFSPLAYSDESVSVFNKHLECSPMHCIM